jgi:triosephosphate isomerase (TIM)
VIAGNWKMYKTCAEALRFFHAFLPLVADSSHCDIVVAPPYTALAASVGATRGSNVTISAQNVHGLPDGAFTGEIATCMLVEAGCTGVIVGHSERRAYYNETDESVHRKTKAALAAGLTPIVCVGETFNEREANQTEAVLERQFEDGLGALTTAEFSRILLAYEPVWAIGTGRTATPEIAAQSHRYLRSLAAEKFSSQQASALRILYGGSVKPENIRGLMEQSEIDGALVGGASLDPQSFAAIVNY